MENSGLVHMIRNEKYEEIALMFDLFSKVPEAFNILGKNLAQFIISEGSKLVLDDKLKHDEFVARVIELREKMMNIYIKSFNKDNSIDLAIKNAFESFIN
jgi:cullin 3